MLITRLWKQQPGEFFFLSTKDKNDKWRDHPFKRTELDEVDEFIRDNKDKNIYFCPHGFKRPRRTGENAVLPKLLWSDMDEADPRTLKLPPTIAIESSPGRYVGLWLLDKPMTEDVNRRLSYLIGADKSGWDLSQVLRVPGTINYKYPDLPRAKIVWGDRPEWKLSDIEKQLPDDDESIDTYEVTDASKIFRQYERKLSAMARRELMTKKEPPEGKRSEMFMRLVFECMEAGMTKVEGCTVLKASVWNKYSGRRDEDKQVSSAWDKATNKKLQGHAVAGEKDGEFAPVRADTLQWKPTTWLWYPRVPRNAMTLVAAKGGTGKGLFSCDITARVTTGEYWPCSKERIGAGNVLWGEAEDRLEQTVIPRLIAAKADLSKIHFTDPSKFVEHDIGQFIREHKIGLMVLSPLVSFLDGMEDANAQLDTRRALEHLEAVTEGTDCAILGVMHLNKKPDLSAVERILGSVEFANFSRSILLLNKDEDGIVRVMHPKHNLGPGAPDLIFQSINRRQKQHPRGQFVGIDWDEPEDNVDADRSFERKAGKKKDEEDGSQSAGEWLRDYLADGEEHATEDIFKAAEKLSHSVAALKRAKLRASGAIRHRKVGRNDSVWRLVASAR